MPHLTTVRVVHGLPPNYQAIVAALGAPAPDVCFAYGDTIYRQRPGQDIPTHLVEHEQVHLRQQGQAGGPEAWWDRYLADPEFRLAQELEAYRAQYRWIASNWPKEPRRQALKQLAKQLAGRTYGHLLLPDAARRAIEARREA